MRIVNLPRVTVSQNTDYQLEAPSSGLVMAIDGRFSGIYTTSGANGGGHLDTAFGPWGRFDVFANDRNIISMDAVDYRHLTALTQSTYMQLDPILTLADTTAGGQNGPAPFLAQGRLDFQKLIPRQLGRGAGMLINARGQKIVISGRTLDAARLGNLCTSITGQIDWSLEINTSGGEEKYFEPFIFSEKYPLTASDAVLVTKKWTQDLAVVGYMVRIEDADKVRGGNPNIGRSDTLVRAAKLIHRKENAIEKTIVPKRRWYDLNQQAGRAFGLVNVRNGIWYHTFDDPETDLVDVQWVRPGEEFSFEFDTNGAQDLRDTAVGATDAVIAAGDQAVVTWICGRPVNFSRLDMKRDES
jgi:hypothetical protein